jgi:hypothetical protein
LNATLLSQTFVEEKRAKKTQEKPAPEIKIAEDKLPENTAPKAAGKKPVHPVRERNPEREKERVPSGHEPSGPVVGFGAILPGFMAQKFTISKQVSEDAE